MDSRIIDDFILNQKIKNTRLNGIHTTHNTLLLHEGEQKPNLVLNFLAKFTTHLNV